MKTAKKENFISFCILMLIGIVITILLRNENCWDLANYHYYNAFAFLNDRSEADLIPNFMHGFFNPIIELPLYFYIQYFNDSPNILYALQGIWSGLFLFVLYKICSLFFDKTKKGYFYSALTLLTTVTAQATFSQMGTSTNEITVACFILWGFYILLKMIKFKETQNLKKFLLAGLIMGIGLGLKQTTITYCIASGLTLILCHRYLKSPLKSISVFAVGGLVGYLIINGYFMYKYWVMYGNPFFPFLNDIFHSPYFSNINYRDDKYLPSLSTFFIYPFLWNINPQAIYEGVYVDIRLTLFYVLVICIFAFLLIKKQFKIFYQKQQLLTALLVFISLSFLIWMALFSIMRYTVIIEAIGAIIFIKLFDLYNKKKHFIFCGCHGLLISILIFLPYWYQFPEAVLDKHIELQKIYLPDNTLVKIYGAPVAFVIPELAKNAKNLKTITYYRRCEDFRLPCQMGTGADFAEYGPFLQKRKKIEEEHNGPVVYIYTDDFNVFATVDQIESYYTEFLKLCNKSFKIGLIKDQNECDDKYFNAMTLVEKYRVDEPDYYCQPLKNNLVTELNICVPKELKSQILGE